MKAKRPKKKERRTEAETRAGTRPRIFDGSHELAEYPGQVNVLRSALEDARASQAYFRSLFKSAPVSLILHDQTGQILEMNEAAALLLETSPRKSVLLTLAQFIALPDCGAWLDHMRHCRIRRRATTDAALRTRSGKTVPVELISIAEPQHLNRAPLRFRTSIIDLTQRKAVEAARQRGEQNYHRLVDLIEGIVWEADPNTLDILFVNRKAEQMLGYSVEDWKYPGFWQNRIFPPDRERVLNEIQRKLSVERELRIDYRVTAADRRIVWLHDSIRLIQEGGGHKLLGVAIDITDQRDAQDRLFHWNQELERRVQERTGELRKTVEELEAFSYSISHDMRAPLRAMRGYAEFVADDKESGPKTRDFLQRIINSATRLDSLIQDVLQYSGICRGHLELKPMALGPVLQNILKDYPNLSAEKASIRIEEPLPGVYGHEAFVSQTLSNLLTNAVKFVPPNRRPEVRVRAEEATRENAKGDTQRWVRVWVEDNGVGIELENQKRIFRMFERIHSTEQYEGTGIGLAIVLKAVTRMGGHVGVESNPGQGSKFWFELRPA